MFFLVFIKQKLECKIPALKTDRQTLRTDRVKLDAEQGKRGVKNLRILRIAVRAGGWQGYAPKSFHQHTPVRHQKQYRGLWL